MFSFGLLDKDNAEVLLRIYVYAWSIENCSVFLLIIFTLC